MNQLMLNLADGLEEVDALCFEIPRFVLKRNARKGRSTYPHHRRHTGAIKADNQISLVLPPPRLRRRGTKKWAKYSFEAVELARRMRERRATYRDIAETINSKFCHPNGEAYSVSWITIRDWTHHFHRMLR